MDNHTTAVALDLKYGVDEWTPETKDKMKEVFNVMLLHATYLNVDAIKYDSGTPKKAVALADAENCMQLCEWYKENIMTHL